MNKLVVLVLLLAMLASVAYASEIVADYDYASAQSYSDPNFYTSSDPGMWDWKMVDWTKVDFGRAELYNSPEFYKNIPLDKYNSLDYKQIDYKQIRQDRIDSDKYFKDMGCVRCSLDRKGRKMIFSKNKITHMNGDSATIPGKYPDEAIFIVAENRIEVIIPKTTKTINPPDGDSVTINTQGRQITFTDGTTINGKISFENNQAHINKGEKATINRVEITASQNQVDIYNDGKSHEGNYVSFGQKNIIIQGDQFSANFKEGNKYVKVNEEENDRLLITPKNNGKIIITKNEKQAPEVVVTGPKTQKEWAEITNGKFEATIGNEGVMKINADKALKTIFGSVPMQIKILDEKGKSLILGENGEEGKIVIDNENDLSYASMDAEVDENGIATCPGEETPTGNVITGQGFLSRLSAKVSCFTGSAGFYDNAKIYLWKHLEETFGKGTQFNIEFKGIEKWSYSELDSIAENLFELYKLSPNMVGALKSIEIEDVSIIEALDDKDYSAYCTQEGRMVISDSIIMGGFTFGTFAHEAAHALHFKLKREGGAYAFDNQWYQIHDEGDQFKGWALYGTKTKDDGVGRMWNDRSSLNLLGRVYDEFFGAKDGLVRPYGDRTYGENDPNANMEDVATYVEEIAESGTVPNFENEKYYKKVWLLCYYGFLQKNQGICTSWRW